MTREELETNLGTIALSGTRKFMEKVSDANPSKHDLIGQFGVGFYSSFMPGKKVDVYTRSFKENSPGLFWTSTGLGEYEVAEAENVKVGTKIIIHLKEEDLQFADPDLVRGLIQKYSSFVNFPIQINGERSNTVQPLWMKGKNEVSEKEYNEFFKFISHSNQEPLGQLHYHTDSPIHIRSLLFVPKFNEEILGMRRIESGISLYCRKVLIKSNAKELLPEWLRFIKGCVDSEDIPLNLSREILQNNLLISKIRRTLTGKIIRFLDELSRINPANYESFYREFNMMIKEGVCTDQENKNEIASLLRFETSKSNGKQISLTEYVDRMNKDQKAIYYLQAPSREIAEASPYFEPFKAKDIEVLFLCNTMDGFVMNHLREFKSLSISSAEDSGSQFKQTDIDKPVSEEISKSVIEQFKNTLGDKIESVCATERITTAPALIVDHQPATMTKLMKAMQPDMAFKMPPQKLELNMQHSIIQKLPSLFQTDPSLADLIVKQIYDNALIAAGISDDARPFVSRMNDIIEKMLK